MKKDNELKCEVMTREIRLLYYNNYLFEKSVITKREHDKINLAIISKCGKIRLSELAKVSSEERFFSARHT